MKSRVVVTASSKQSTKVDAFLSSNLYPNQSWIPPMRSSDQSMKGGAPPPFYSVAPMMDVTDRHFRALARLISQFATLYTEMVVDRTLIHNPKLRLLELRIPKDPPQHPVVLQVGGSDAFLMAKATAFAADYPYAEININCGCPSPKVADNGCFGAALMRTPSVVANIAREMSKHVKVPITVKCRLGLNWDTSYEPLYEFVRIVHEDGGVMHFIIHARNAVLGGLSPAQNRRIPQLRYDVVYRLMEDFPHLRFSINGGIRTIEDALVHLSRGIHGVMVGRAVMDAPWQALAEVDARIYGKPNLQRDGSVTTRRHILREYKSYAEREVTETGCPPRAVLKPLLNLFHGERNGKAFRRTIDDGLKSHDSVEKIIDSAISIIPEEILDALPGQKFMHLASDGYRCSDEQVLESSESRETSFNSAPESIVCGGDKMNPYS